MNELVKVENGVAILQPEIIDLVVNFETTMKELKTKEDELKQAILSEMENKNIIKIDGDKLLINYISPSDRETFDSKSFKAEHQDLYDEYVKMSSVKSSIRIKVK